MIRGKVPKITAIGIFKQSVIAVNDHTIEWIDARDWRLADLAKAIGIDLEHSVKAQITLQVVEGPCEICGNPTTGDKLCEKCGKMICDNCSQMDSTDRYCPQCFSTVTNPAAIQSNTP